MKVTSDSAWRNYERASRRLAMIEEHLGLAKREETFRRLALSNPSGDLGDVIIHHLRLAQDDISGAILSKARADVAECRDELRRSLDDDAKAKPFTTAHEAVAP